MAYDPQKTKLLLPVVGAFAGQPGGDFINDLANQLREAEAEIRNALGTASQAERDVTRITAELESAQQTIVRLRSGSTGYTEMLLALQTIAKNPKGSQKLAQQAVEAATGVKAPAPTEAAKA